MNSPHAQILFDVINYSVIAIDFSILFLILGVFLFSVEMSLVIM